MNNDNFQFFNNNTNKIKYIFVLIYLIIILNKINLWHLFQS